MPHGAIVPQPTSALCRRVTAALYTFDGQPHTCVALSFAAETGMQRYVPQPVYLISVARG
jgi:hypothetical protein